MSREVLRDVIKYLPAKVIPALVGILAIPILTHLLSPEQYGHYLLAITSLILIASFCISWLVSVTIRFYVVYGVEQLFHVCRPFLVAAVLFSCMLWTVVSLLIGGVFESKGYILIGILWLVAYGTFEYFAGWLRARNLVKSYSLALSWRSVTGLLVAVTLLRFGYQGGEIVIFGAASAMLFALFFLPRYALQADQTLPKTTETKRRNQTLLRYGIPAAFINLITIGLSLADRYVIGAQMGAESVAVYGANYDLAEKTVFFANSMLLLSSSVIGFRIFEQEGENKAAAFLSNLMRLYILAAPPLVVGLAILSPQIVAILLPEKYMEGTLVFPIVALSGLFVGIMHRYSLLLSFHNRTDIIMWCSAGALLINLLSCFLLIPLYGLVGAAISTTIAYVSWLFLIRLSAMRYQGPIFPWKTLIRVCCALLFAAGTMYGIILLVSTVNLLVLLVNFMFGILVYIFVLFFLKEVSQNEYRAIIHALSIKFRKD